MRLVVDLETDGLLPELTKIHCIAAQDPETLKRYGFTTDDSDEYGSIEEGIEFLKTADCLIAHNGVNFDFEVFRKLYDWYPENTIDTIVLSQLIKSDIKDSDFQYFNLPLHDDQKMPGKYLGSHALAAWGYRLKEHKGDYGVDEDGKPIEGCWETFSAEMMKYCVQDTYITVKLLKLLEARNYSKQAIELEHDVARILQKQEKTGVYFNKAKAEELYSTLAGRRQEIKDTLRAKYKGKKIPMKTPQYYTAELYLGDEEHILKGATKKKVEEQLRKLKASNKERLGNVTFKKLFDLIETGPIKIKEVNFNPASRQQIGVVLQEYHGWKPKEFTDTGQPKIDETVLEGLPYEEAKLFNEYLLIQKRIGMVCEGTHSWLNHCKEDNRIHGRMKHNGAVTGRGTHSSPNLGQVPAAYSPYGVECREMFTVPEGYVLVGSDASGLELRCLANYLKLYDGGVYEKAACYGTKEEGTDVHTINQHSAELESRDLAKKFIYTWLYGGGNYKIGLTVGVTDEDIAEARETHQRMVEFQKDGGKLYGVPEYALLGKALYYFKMQNETAIKQKRQPKRYDVKDWAAWIKGYTLKEKFLAANPAINELRTAVEEAVEERGFLEGLDGRELHIRSAYAALNTLLQSAGAIICKQWMVQVNKEIDRRGLDAKQVLWVHDELQIESHKDCAEEVAKICEEEMKTVGEKFLHWDCPLEAEAEIGATWAETH